MEKFDLNNIFQGISTLLQSDPSIMYARIGLILLGILLVYLGRRGILEPLVMIPMGLGMAAVNAGVLIMPGGVQGNLFLDPMVTDTDQLMNILQIDFLQPVYTFMFSNGLIACLIFMGIGTMLDINFLLAKPLQSMFLALCAELGTFAVVPIAFAMGLSPNDSASIAMVGGAPLVVKLVEGTIVDSLSILVNPKEPLKPKITEITGITNEPWHFRYVGREISMDMKDSGLCLEEYLGAV